MAKKDFNEFRFGGLNAKEHSKKYLTMDRVGNEEKKIVVNVADSHLLKTKYGYALILDRNHVVFLKEWQVNENYYGNEVLLSQDFFNVKEWGEFEEFTNDETVLNYENWVLTANEQQKEVDEDGNKTNAVRWEK